MCKNVGCNKTIRNTIFIAIAKKHKNPKFSTNPPQRQLSFGLNLFKKNIICKSENLYCYYYISVTIEVFYGL